VNFFIKLTLFLCCLSMLAHVVHADAYADPTERAFVATMETLGFDTQTARFCNLSPAYLFAADQVRFELYTNIVTLQGLKNFSPESKARHTTAKQMAEAFDTGVKRSLLSGAPPTQTCMNLKAGESARLLTYQKAVPFIRAQTALLLSVDRKHDHF